MDPLNIPFDVTFKVVQAIQRRRCMSALRKGPKSYRHARQGALSILSFEKTPSIFHRQSKLDPSSSGTLAIAVPKLSSNLTETLETYVSISCRFCIAALVTPTRLGASRA